MMRLLVGLVGLVLVVGCAGASEAPYAFDSTYGVPDACTVRTTAPELVLLRCSAGAELAESCEGGSSLTVELWTRPGADQTPYGVTGRLELTCRSE